MNIFLKTDHLDSLTILIGKDCFEKQIQKLNFFETDFCEESYTVKHPVENTINNSHEDDFYENYIYRNYLLKNNPIDYYLSHRDIPI